MTATGLSATPQEYRQRLDEQPDAQIDSWVAELMRDVSIRRGVLTVLAELRHALGADEAILRRLFAAGGGPSAAVGHTSDGQMMVPAISLRYFVPGTRALMPDARARLIEFLVASFEEIVYI